MNEIGRHIHRHTIAAQNTRHEIERSPKFTPTPSVYYDPKWIVCHLILAYFEVQSQLAESISKANKQIDISLWIVANEMPFNRRRDLNGSIYIEPMNIQMETIRYYFEFC